MVNTPRKRILRRAGIGLVSLLIGAATTAVASPSFAEFVGDNELGTIVLVTVPPAVLALDKWWRERRS